MIEFLIFKVRLAGYIHLELAEGVLVDAGEDDAGMRLAAGELFELLHGRLRIGIRDRADGEGDEHLVRVQAGVAVAEMGDLEMLDRLDDLRGDERDLVRNVAERLEGVQEAGGHGAEQIRRAAGDDPPVRQLERGGGAVGFLGAVERRLDDRALIGRDADALHEKLLTVHLRGIAEAADLAAGRLIIAADDLAPRGGTADGVVADAVARHVDAHVRGALVG